MFSKPRMRGLNQKRRSHPDNRVNHLMKAGEKLDEGTRRSPKHSAPLQDSRAAFIKSAISALQ
jgi:hypothetical protein